MKHTIQDGDTLSAIAERYLGNAFAYPDLWRRNQSVLAAAQQHGTARRRMRGPDWIFPGTVIEIPDGQSLTYPGWPAVQTEPVQTT